MRPQVIISLNGFQATEHDVLTGKYERGVYQYNEFNLTIESFNDFSIGPINRDSIQVTMHYKENTNQTDLIYVIPSMLIIAMVFLMIFYIN